MIGEAADGREAVALAESRQSRRGRHGHRHAEPERHRSRPPDRQPIRRTAVVILSMHSDESYVLRALKAGARAYLLKDSAEADLMNAVRAVSEGKAFFSPAISKMLVEDYMRQLEERDVEDSYELLTTREREILQLLAEGKNQQGGRRHAEPQPVHGGDPPQQHPAEAEPAQRAGADPVRRAQGDHRLDPHRPPASGGPISGCSIVSRSSLASASRSRGTCTRTHLCRNPSTS